MTIWKRTTYWTAAEDRRLAILWDAEWTTASIGADLGRGKNAVCGRARRLKLPMRKCPVTLRRIDLEKARQIDHGLQAARAAIARAA